VAISGSILNRRYGGTGFGLWILALLLCPLALALNPSLDVSQYAHQSWKFREGFTKGEIFAIAQTPDGYLKFHAVTYMLPDRPEARTKLEGVIEQARAAISEGRDAVQGLRSSTLVNNELGPAISTFVQGLGGDPACRVQVEGASRELAPLVRDEIYRIAIEALRNAFRHSQAKHIEVEIHYARQQLQLRIRDDGKGIDQKILSEGGRPGHHGLPGMQERAKLAGGKLSVWSKPGSGTEIELTIPASIAYAKPSGLREPVRLGHES